MRRVVRLRVRRIPVAQLQTSWIEGMWSLYATHYENVTRSTFAHDLSDKRYVFLGLEGGTGAVKAFSTASLRSLVFRGRRVGIYFSGDTMVDPRYWGQRVLHRGVVAMLLAWRLRHPLHRLYWHLTCSGYRTFLTLANNFAEYWPHPARATPAWERELIDAITRERFGTKWCPEHGVVHEDARLKAHVAPFTPEVSEVPAVRFFLQRNPGYERGDELSVIGRVDTRFFLRVALKLATGPPNAGSAAWDEARPRVDAAHDAR